MSNNRNKKKYEKKNPIEHCLLRPDMYVGSTRLRKVDEYVAEKSKDGTYKIVWKNIRSSPAILRVFIEILSNAIDNVQRSKNTDTPCTKIKVTIDEETGETSVWNDGDIIPVEIHKEEGCYNHTLIFGHMLTGSSYNDEEERMIAGRNGLGGKLTSIFSQKFEVQGYDPSVKKLFTQVWTNNMRTVTEPVLRKRTFDKGFTHVKWTPDFKLFGLKKYTKDIIELYTRHVLDAAMLSNVSVYLNGTILPVKSITQYSGLYKSLTDEKLLIKTKNCTVLVTPSMESQIVSFVNGIYTRLGGQHVDAWTEKIFRPIVNKFNGKSKKSKSSPKININDVKQFFRLFIVSNVIRPEFDGQEKNKLESPAVKAVVKKNQINYICKWSVMEKIEDVIRAKEMIVLRKVERKKKNVKIEGLDPANNAGGKHSHLCSLFICEGLSAKTYVVAGINTGVYGKAGRDWFGVLPVTGKVLNVRNATPSSIAANKVIVSLIQALGLKHGLDYRLEKNFKTLRYGKVILIADSDCDGIHIEGLLLNFIHVLFPTLLLRNVPYVVSMKTPIVRVFKKGKTKDLLFYDERRFNQYLKESKTKVNAKYYKGLGTTREEDVPDTFGSKMVEYCNDTTTGDNMNKVFHKKYSDARKLWLGRYDPDQETFSLDKQSKICKMGLSNFLNNEMIKFSHADCARSIPSGIDGLKESQRKILYAVRKRKLNFNGKSLKVAQLSGYTAEHSNYHHGEQNLQDTIVGMASGFVGSNNIPLLYPDGGFGSRLAGGKDAASARYIFTKKEELTDYIFRIEDDPLLTPVNDDGDLVQPEFYIPIIPMILVNGCTGIGTGWSCTVPCFNPIDIIDSIKEWIDNDGEVMLEDPDTNEVCCMLPDLVPWYRGFKGTIEPCGDNRFKTQGILSRGSKRDTVEITELPIGMWTNKFKESCEDLLTNKKLKRIKNYSGTQNVHFILTESPDGISCNITNMKLHSYLYTSNMVLFNEKDQLKKFTSPQEIIDTFCVVRLRYYHLRKEYQIKSLQQKLKIIGNKSKFIKEVIEKTIPLAEKDESTIITQLEEKNYDKDPIENNYNYLLKLPLRSLTTDKVRKLNQDIKKLKQTLSILKNTKVESIWLKELNELKKVYLKWIKDMEKRIPKKNKTKRKK